MQARPPCETCESCENPRQHWAVGRYSGLRIVAKGCESPRIAEAMPVSQHFSAGHGPSSALPEGRPKLWRYESLDSRRLRNEVYKTVVGQRTRLDCPRVMRTREEFLGRGAPR